MPEPEFVPVAPPGTTITPAPFWRRQRKASIGFVLVTLGIDAFGIGVVIPVLPELVRQLSGRAISAASIWVGLLVSAYAVAQFFAAPVLGGLSDRFGRRPVILMSVAGICLNYILLAVAPNLSWILLGRLLAGATAANTSASMAYIADVTPPELRAQRFGLIGATFGLGFVLGPAIGGLVGDYALRGPFVLSAVIAGLNWIYGLIVLPESLQPEFRRRFDWRRANPIGSLGRVARDPFVAKMACAWSGLWFGLGVLQSTFVLYTTLRFHWGPFANGAAFALSGICQAVMQGVLVKRVIRRIGEFRTAIFGCLCTALAFFTYAINPFAWAMLPIIVLQATGSMANPAIRALLSSRAGPSRQGEMQGAISSVEGLTQIIAPLVGGSLFGIFAATNAPIHFPGIAFMLAALVYGCSALFLVSARKEGQGSALDPLGASCASTPLGVTPPDPHP